MSALDLWPELHLPWLLTSGSLLNVFSFFCFLSLMLFELNSLHFP